MAKCTEGCGRNTPDEGHMCDVCFHEYAPDAAHSEMEQWKRDENEGRLGPVFPPNLDAEKRWFKMDPTKKRE